ncbi:MAG: hypothetical protein OEY59_01220 [Deltaproteobacteria bacterium]|nr:hypothetical protein [Deltaproteobacteria bacterium]
MQFKNLLYVISAIAILLWLPSCGGSKPSPRSVENFLTLADVLGKSSFNEDSPEIRVINVKAKAFIKQDDTRTARQKAMGIASNMAVDSMVRELLSSETYNKHFADIETFFSKDIQKFIDASEVNGEKRIYLDKYYGISASFKVNRQKVLVALQKDLKLIDNSMSTLITIITSKKDLDLSSVNFKFQDIEDALMNQIQTDLNQRGLRAMDYRNALVSLQTDEVKKKEVEKISKEQFMAMISGSKAGQANLNQQVENAESFYTTGLTLLKKLARVVVEINILTVSKKPESMSLSLNVTAKNISTGTGGAFANQVIPIARKGGAKTDDAMMLTALIGDAYEAIAAKFIPQVIKEMSTIDTKGNKLVAYDLVLKGFDGKDSRKIRKAIQSSQGDQFRYIDFDNTLSRAEPPMNVVFVRYAGKTSELGDKMMELFDGEGISAQEPLVAPGLTDVVFSKLEK